MFMDPARFFRREGAGWRAEKGLRGHCPVACAPPVALRARGQTSGLRSSASLFPSATSVRTTGAAGESGMTDASQT
jgi:hypothetical protein